MDDSDKKYVGEALRQLAAVHRVKYASDMFAGYWAGLKDLTLEQFNAALLDIQKNAMWMPKPSEFRASLRKGWL